jgi:phosphoribosylamine---glycine ligase
MKILLIGSGGREHALAWKLAQSSRVNEVLVAPGNAGTYTEPKCRNVDIAGNDLPALLALAISENVAFTVVGPEVPLVAGIVDLFRAQNIKIFGPTQAAAQLEGSKAYAKDFLARHKIPTAYYAVFDDVELAMDHLYDVGAPIVIKADGLAAGKGVVVAMTFAEAEAAIVDMLSGNKLGDAGSRVVIEEFLQGEEASFICMVDGKTALPMATSQDHKRVYDGDTGPNTGGMGAYSPAAVVTPDVHARVMREVIEPTVQGMIADGIPFTGFLYAGLMIDDDGAPKVIEFNVRFGDPETQPVMMRLQSDLVDLIEASFEQQLHEAKVYWSPQSALGVVMAAENYPETPKTGDVIAGLQAALPAGSKIFHAGTKRSNGQVLTSGGRVLCACALGNTVADAQRLAYAAVSTIEWDGEFHRKDIGWRAIEREKNNYA